MGFADKRRQRADQESQNWPFVVNMLIAGHELQLAEEDGIPEEEQTDRATSARDAVISLVGWDHIVETFISADHELNTSDKEHVTQVTLEASGYKARLGRFPRTGLATFLNAGREGSTTWADGRRSERLGGVELQITAPANHSDLNRNAICIAGGQFLEDIP